MRRSVLAKWILISFIYDLLALSQRALSLGSLSLWQPNLSKRASCSCKRFRQRNNV